MGKYLEAARKIRAVMDAAGAMLTDDQALTVRELYQPWRAGKEYAMDERFRQGDDLYKVVKPHTSQADWPPGEGTESLYARIDVTHAGTLNDPIPYAGNTALESGKYYSQGGVVYKCTRDTINPVYNPLADLVGLYVEVT